MEFLFYNIEGICNKLNQTYGGLHRNKENVTGSSRDGDSHPRTWGSSQQMAMCKKRPRDIKEVNQGSH